MRRSERHSSRLTSRGLWPSATRRSWTKTYDETHTQGQLRLANACQATQDLDECGGLPRGQRLRTRRGLELRPVGLGSPSGGGTTTRRPQRGFFISARLAVVAELADPTHHEVRGRHQAATWTDQARPTHLGWGVVSHPRLQTIPVPLELENTMSASIHDRSFYSASGGGGGVSRWRNCSSGISN